MKIVVTATNLVDLVTININYFKDDRGFFIEPWHKRDFAEAGLHLEFVQEGHSRSKKGVLRGLHYQNLSAPMGKLVRCTSGEVFEVAVDLRMSSKTFGKWFGVRLSAENKTLLYIPVGFALGFETLSDSAEVQYKQTGYYTKSAEGTIAWNDPELAISWPILPPFLSQRDQMGKTLNKYRKHPDFS